MIKKLILLVSLFLFSTTAHYEQEIFLENIEVITRVYTNNQNSNTNLVREYDPNLGKQLGAFALTSYCGKKKIQKWKCGKTCKEYPNMTDITVIKNKKKNQAFVGYYTDDNAIVIAWRGTLALRNWLEDFDFPLVQYPYCEGCSVHGGFLKAYEAMAEEVWDAFYETYQKYPNAQIYLTGQSLGAALSTIHAGDLIQKGITDFTWYNYGSPRVGNYNFAKWVVESLDGRMFRVVNQRDPVPHIPTRGMGYWHLAEEVFYVNNSEPDSYHLLCDMSGEDPNCSDQYNFNLLYAFDHLSYMGYNWVTRISLCQI